MTEVQDTRPETPLLRVVAGQVASDEMAAVTVVLLARLAGGEILRHSPGTWRWRAPVAFLPAQSWQSVLWTLRSSSSGRARPA